MPRASYPKWSALEKGALRDLVAAGLPPQECADKLGRSLLSIKNMMTLMRLTDPLEYTVPLAFEAAQADRIRRQSLRFAADGQRLWARERFAFLTQVPPLSTDHGDQSSAGIVLPVCVSSRNLAASDEGAAVFSGSR